MTSTRAFVYVDFDLCVIYIWGEFVPDPNATIPSLSDLVVGDSELFTGEVSLGLLIVIKVKSKILLFYFALGLTS